MQTPSPNSGGEKAYVITGPTSGIGRATALELAAHGTVVLVGRSAEKLHALQQVIERRGQRAVSVVCDLSDIRSAQRAGSEIAALGLPLAGLLNNAGISPMGPRTNAQGWDLAFATNHLGPFVLTETLIPHLPDGANVVFTVSGVEDPGRRPARMAGYRGGRYISAEASARGEWAPDGSTRPGFDAYATSKQCELAAAMELARETPRLHVNAVEPGFNPGTGLGRDAPLLLQWVARYLLAPLAPLVKYWSTPKRAARVLAGVLTSDSGDTGVYYDENGRPMRASALIRDPAFTARVVAETRELIASGPPLDT